MKTFDSDGVEIAYLDEGEGDPVLLIHGFASNVATNWIGPGWVKALTEAGFRVVAYDNRGHGKSAKLYDTKDYGAPLMAEIEKAMDCVSICPPRLELSSRIKSPPSLNGPSDASTMRPLLKLRTGSAPMRLVMSAIIAVPVRL